MASFTYNSAKVKIADGSINWTSDTIKVALCTSSYTPNQKTHTWFSDVTNEVSGTNYTAGGYTLSGKTLTQDNTNNRSVFDSSEISQSSVTIASYRYLVVYKSTGVAATSPLITVIDLGTDYSVDNEILAITWSTAGVFNIT
jgi:hypothetical protein